MLTLKQLGRTDRAIVIVNTNGYYEPMQRLLEHTAQTHFMSHNCLELYKLGRYAEPGARLYKFIWFRKAEV